MKLSSPAFENYAAIPQKYSCEGTGVNPPLLIQEVPADAKSLVLLIDDPDAPGGTFNHWVMWNIPPTTKKIGEDEIPPGAIEGENSSGEIGFIAPCPPTGIHNYRFILWALNQPLAIPEGATREQVESTLEQFVLARAELVGTYQKK
jgi:Raf kinase inhibitor-like YbhB/YbcL family protein